MKIDLVFLIKAISDCENIFIYHKEGDRALRYLSRFFKIDKGEDAIIIDSPFIDSFTHHRLIEGDEISVFFHTAGFRFQFDSVVNDSMLLDLDGGVQVPALKIAFPGKLLDGNRRSLFRVAVHLDQSIRVRYFILGNEDSGITFEDSLAVDYEGIEAIMIDISENGIAVQMKRPVNIDMGDRLRLWFRLEDEEGKEIEIEGLVRNIRFFPGSDVHICGIEFSRDESLKNKESLRKIACYIMARQKDNISFFTVDPHVSKNPFVQKIVDNEVTEELLNLVLIKKIPMTEEEYLESLVYIMRFDKFRFQAHKALLAIPSKLKEGYIQGLDANHRVVQYLLEEAIKKRSFKIIAGALNNQYLPVESLSIVAKKGTQRMLRILMANKIKLIAFPELMDEIEANVNATPAFKEQVAKFKTGFVQEVKTEMIPEERVMENVREMVTAQQEEEEPEVTNEPVSLETRGLIDKALSKLWKINKMTLQQRVRLALTGTKAERMILGKDTNMLVVEAVVDSPNTTGEEIAIILQNRTLTKELILKVLENTKWLEDYGVILALLQHPQLPVRRATGLLRKLHPQDLEKLGEDRTLGPVVRNLAKYFDSKK